MHNRITEGSSNICLLKTRKQSAGPKPQASGTILPTCKPTIITLRSLSSVSMNTRQNASVVRSAPAQKPTSMAGDLMRITHALRDE